MILHLLSLLQNLNHHENVTKLTEATFEQFVKKRDRESVWIIMFSSLTCPACKHVLPKFREAAGHAEGMIKFGLVMVDRCRNIAEEYGITQLPTFRIFPSNGDVEYAGDRRVKSFLDIAASYLVDSSPKAMPEWNGQKNKK